MQINKVIKTDLAKEDLLEIFDYIDENANEETAVKYLKKLESTMEIIAKNPKIGRRWSGTLRAFPKDRYIIFYRPKGKIIEIIRILHASRDAESQF